MEVGRLMTVFIVCQIKDCNNIYEYKCLCDDTHLVGGNIEWKGNIIFQHPKYLCTKHWLAFQEAEEEAGVNG